MRFLASLVAVLLVACSTKPISEFDGIAIPADRIYSAQLLASSDGNAGRAVVSFYRDRGFVGSGCSHDLLVNNERAFSLRAGEFVRIALPPGDYFFRLEMGGGICPNIATSQDAVLKAGDKRAYRILTPSDGSLRLTRIE